MKRKKDVIIELSFNLPYIALPQEWTFSSHLFFHTFVSLWLPVKDLFHVLILILQFYKSNNKEATCIIRFFVYIESRQI